MELLRFTVETGHHQRAQVPLIIPITQNLPSTALAVHRLSTGEILPAQISTSGVSFLLSSLPAGIKEHFALIEAPTPLTTSIQVTEEGDDLTFTLDGKLVTRYHFRGPDLARPYFWPVLGPGGHELTRAWPIIPDRPGETHDHPHHRSMWIAYGELDGIDAWSELPGHGRTIHVRFDSIASGPVFGGFIETTRWIDSFGRQLLEEQRTVRLYHCEETMRLLDLELLWTFERKDERGRRYSLGHVYVGDTKEAGLISIRVATSMDAKANGRIENAWGGVSETETWGKRAPWCDYSGPVDGEIVGIAAFDHPTNLHFPCYWHVRNYGLMGANPFSGENFTGNPRENGATVFHPGDQLHFRYRVFMHRGNAAEAGIGNHWLSFGFPPAIRVESK